ncbi:hypothetical protein PV087_28935, partial [Klebsiella pneumoniae]
MIDNRTVSAIDLALQKHPTPVGDLFAAIRHGRMKRCFSRDTAIRYLAFFMTSRAFGRSGFKQRYPDVQVIHPLNPELSSWQRGAVTTEYFNAHQRT